MGTSPFRDPTAVSQSEPAWGMRTRLHSPPGFPAVPSSLLLPRGLGALGTQGRQPQRSPGLGAQVSKGTAEGPASSSE